MNKNIMLFYLFGKASQTFKFFNAICQEYGSLTLGDLARHCYKDKYWILWEVK